MDESGDLRPLRLAALQLANDARSGRAELKREIAAGAVRVADVLVDPPPEATGISLAALLLSQRQRELLAVELRAHDPLARRLRARTAADRPALDRLP